MNKIPPGVRTLLKIDKLFEWVAVGLVKPVKFSLPAFCPYGRYLVDSSARLVAHVTFTAVLLAVLFAPIAHFAEYQYVYPAIIEGMQHGVSEAIQFLATHAHAAGLVAAGYYFIAAVIPYEPYDKYDKDYRRRNAPEGPFCWEDLLSTLIAAGAISLTFYLAFYTPGLISADRSLLHLAVLSLLAAGIPFSMARNLFARKWAPDDGGYSLPYSLIEWSSSWKMAFAVIILLTTTTGFLLSWTNRTPIELLFYGHLAGTMYVARIMRLTVYQDRDGMVNIRPPLRTLGAVTRLPLVYTTVVLYMIGFDGAMALNYPIYCTFAPLAVGLAYLAFRYLRTGGDMYKVLPRVKYDPDEFDAFEYVRQNSPLLSYEQAKALRPENRVWTVLGKAAFRLRSINRRLPEAEMIDRDTTASLTYEVDSTYSRRRRRIFNAQAELGRVQRSLRSAETTVDSELREDIEKANEALAEAYELNETAGKQIEEFLNTFLFDG